MASGFYNTYDYHGSYVAIWKSNSNLLLGIPDLCEYLAKGGVRT